MEPDFEICRECHSARGCPSGLDFDVELPMGWASETSTVDLCSNGLMQMLWQARSADAALKLQARACVDTLAPRDLQAAIDQWCGHPALQVAEPASALPDLAHHRALGGLARQGPGPAAAWVWLAYVQHQGCVLELRLDSPASRCATAQRVWQCVAASWHVRGAAAPKARAERPTPVRNAWWPRALALAGQGRMEQALALIQAQDLQANGLLAQAELLSLHMRNALAAGHLSDALRAQERMVDCKAAYARSADGDMAGLLRMDERDRFLSQLRRRPAQPSPP